MGQTVKFSFREGKDRIREAVKVWYEDLIQNDLQEIKTTIEDEDCEDKINSISNQIELINLQERDEVDTLNKIDSAITLTELCKASEGTPFGDDMYTFLYLLTGTDYEEK